jgi:steroid 5-alpha reductase family enzyme
LSVVVLLLVGWAAMVAMRAAFWWVERTKRDAGVVDVGWTAGLWSTRLALFVYVDRAHGKPENGRYQELRARWGKHAQLRYFAFFQLQGLIVVVMSLPFLVIARHSAPLSARSAAAVALWLIAVGGESLAGRQLVAFRAGPARRDAVCRRGFWRFSHHPNCFCEWMHWWTYVLAGVGAPWWRLTLVSRRSSAPSSSA